MITFSITIPFKEFTNLDMSIFIKFTIYRFQIFYLTCHILHLCHSISIGSLFSFAQSSNWLPWCTSLFILLSINISLHIYPHTALLTILDVVKSVANFLNVPKFQPTIHKFTKQFGFSFAFDATTLWNSLLEEICASPTIVYFRKKLKTYLYAKTYPP